MKYRLSGSLEESTSFINERSEIQFSATKKKQNENKKGNKK